MINFQLEYPKECSQLKGFEKTLIRALDIVEKGNYMRSQKISFLRLIFMRLKVRYIKESEELTLENAKRA